MTLFANSGALASSRLGPLTAHIYTPTRGSCPNTRPEAFPELPNTKKGKVVKLGAPLGQTKSSPFGIVPSPACGPRVLGRGKKVTALPASRLLSRPLDSPSAEGPGGSAGALRRRRAPSAGGGPHARWPPPPRPGSLRTHSATAPRGTRAPTPPARAPRWPGAEGRGGGAAREQKSLSSPIGGTARAAGLTQPARPHSTAPSGERERTRLEGRPGPRGGGGLASIGEGVLAPRRSPWTPPAQPRGRAGVTRSPSAARPRPARRPPPEPQYLQISPGQRLAPRPSAPSPCRCRRCRRRRPAGPPPLRLSPQPSAALTGRPRGGGAGDPESPLLLRLLFFVAGVSGGGEWEDGKVGRWGRRGPQGPREGLQRVLKPPALATPSQAPPPPPPPGSVARGLGGACSSAAPRARGSRTFQHRRLRRAPSPRRRRRRPRDTPPPPPARARGTRPPRRPRAWPPGAPRPLAKGVALGRGWAVGAPRGSRT
ncbi:basic proline-rich protein-like [Prionailurus viverrinus]|uniref:basic proline-rich protein-like n=1 Tax=Prionailurus viverrinus TaxID=61388 RepID=UPI001FF230F9|nr:basic proline-rich protein-like [Prionailurus viverrinus]